MLLCIDIGNTNIVMGVYRENELLTHWRIGTDHQKMPDEYGMLLMTLLDHSKVPSREIDGVALASVVPPLTDTFSEMVRNYHLTTLSFYVCQNGLSNGVVLPASHAISSGVRARS